MSASTSLKRGRASTHNSITHGFGSVSCKKCRSKKIKCGGEYPSCLACVKAEVPCIVADYSAPREFTRKEFAQLQQKLSRLESALSMDESATQCSRPTEVPRLHTSELSPGASRYVGEENGMNFFLTRLQTFRTQQHSSMRERGLLSQVTSPSIFHHPPHRIPPRAVASRALKEYFVGFHVAHPILDESKTCATLENLPSVCADSSAMSNSERHRFFQLNMALALGSIGPFRDGNFELHPFGFFTAALEVKPISESCFSTVEDIENLMLIAHFGVFYNIGWSIWELGRLCMRMSVELGLHQQRAHLTDERAIDSDRCRTIFWEVYLLDRLSSSTLGRPLAIQDSAITARLPGGQQLSLETLLPCPTSPFGWRVGLSRLQSKIHRALSAKDATRLAANNFWGCPAPGQDCHTGRRLSLLRTFHNELLDWRSKAPKSTVPQCLYETSEYYELTYQEARLHLLRTVIDKLPPSTNIPPESLRRPCLQSACTIITTFDNLKRRNQVTFTRAYTHMIFVSSLVVAYCINVDMYQGQHPNGQSADMDYENWLSDVTDPSFNLDASAVWAILSTAGNLLSWFARNMPDVAIYTNFFHDLRKGLETGRANIPREDQREEVSRSASPKSAATKPPTSNTIVAAASRENTQTLVPRPEVDLDTTNPAHESGIYGYSHLSSLGESWSPNDHGPEGPLEIEYQPFLGDTSSLLMESSWPFLDILGMEGVDASMSGYVWDTTAHPQ